MPRVSPVSWHCRGYVTLKLASERFPVLDNVTEVREALIQKVLRAKRDKNYLLG